MDVFEFPAADRFVNRSDDLARLEDWWTGTEANALALYGRRRVGKSWLFRRFAHGKPAIVLVADRRASGPQLDRFATQLEPVVGFRPAIDSVAALVQLLYRVATDSKTLVIVDEFPYLLPTLDAERDSVLTSIQSVMEDRDKSRLKLVFCGSYIGQMEKLMRGPLRGRLTPMVVEPLGFAEAATFMSKSRTAGDVVERFGVAGGMAMYLDEIATARNPASTGVRPGPQPSRTALQRPEGGVGRGAANPGHVLLVAGGAGNGSQVDQRARRRTRAQDDRPSGLSANVGRDADRSARGSGHRTCAGAQQPLRPLRRFPALLVSLRLPISGGPQDGSRSTRALRRRDSPHPQRPSQPYLRGARPDLGAKHRLGNQRRRLVGQRAQRAPQVRCAPDRGDRRGRSATLDRDGRRGVQMDRRARRCQTC